jgi:hypothetical protein
MTARSAAIVLGAILILLGVAGFIDNPVVYGPQSWFVTNLALNVVHIVSGALLVGGALSPLGGGIPLKVLGLLYVVLSIFGFFAVDLIFGFIANSAEDTWLHVAFAIVLLTAGFGLEDEPEMVTV